MRRWGIAFLVLVLAAGCSTTDVPSKPKAPLPVPDPPNTRVIVGTVYYSSGHAVVVPKVETLTGESVFGDARGNYRLLVPVGASGVIVVASDGYAPGAFYSETHSGYAAVPDTAAQVRVDIILTASTPV